MYKIGEFSKLCQLSTKTLRYYAEIGLLEPEYQDDFTGYRYYSAKQLQEAVKIQVMKELGFSLEEIRQSKEEFEIIVEEREKKICRQIYELKQQLKRLEASKALWNKEDMSMFHVRIKKQKPMAVKSIRQIFKNRQEAWEQLTKNTIVINFDNEFQEENLDLEIAIPMDKGEKILFQGTGIPGDVQKESVLMASVVCTKESLDDAYSFLIRYIKEDEDYQRIGNFYEWHIDGETIELQVPIHKLHDRTEEPQNDNTQLPFENDETVVGHWKVVATNCWSEESFRPEHTNWVPEQGDIQDLYFLPEGEHFWFYRWTKGALLSRFSVPIAEGVNPYQIQEINGKNYMFLWFKDRNCFHRGALPELIVLEQMDNKSYDKEELRIRDVLPDGFEKDDTILGKWKVCDFVRNPSSFKYGEYNAGFSKDKLFFKRVQFKQDGICEVQYGKEILKNPDIDWTKGYLREQKSQLLQKYERQIIEGTEYLFIEFKSGDYFYNRQIPWWYVFTREAE